MHVLLLLPYAWDTVPGQRFRIEQWYPQLTSLGVSFHVETLLTEAEQRLLHGEGNSWSKAVMLVKSSIRRLAQLRNIKQYDVIWLHRAALFAGPPLLERLLARMGVPLILEFDDAIYLTDTTQANRRWGALKWSGSKTAQICAMSDGVVVGNDYLAAYARRYNKNVWVVPTTIDTTLYQSRSEYVDQNPVVIGWSGSRTTLAYVRMLDRVIQRVAALTPIRFHAIGTPSYPLDQVDTYAAEWSSASERTELARFDIGVMPLPDVEWARGKCGLKALQYMAAGIPTLASPVGVNGEIIQENVNGFLPRNDDEWVERLVTLARDCRLRERIGRAGRKTVEERYSAAVAVPSVFELLQHLRHRPGGRA